MLNNKDCKIVQDLLPNYIDKLTSEETNKYIENHIQECKECNKILNNMQNQEDDKQELKRNINYVKKYNKRFNILKTILIVIILIIFFAILRNFIIIQSLISKAQKCQIENINNYYSKYCRYDMNYISIIENYNKDGKTIRILKNIEKDTGYIDATFTEFYDGKKHNCYIDSDIKKTAILDIDVDNIIPPIELKTYYILSDNLLNNIKTALTYTVKSVYCNGKKCYKFTYLGNKYNEMDDETYIDSETGLVVRYSGQFTSSNSGIYNEMIDIYYGFGTVAEEDVKEPDISQYEILRNE